MSWLLQHIRWNWTLLESSLDGEAALQKYFSWSGFDSIFRTCWHLDGQSGSFLHPIIGAQIFFILFYNFTQVDTMKSILSLVS